jgi:ribonuclease P protein component
MKPSSFFHQDTEMIHEQENIPALDHPSQAHPRFFGAVPHQEWTGDPAPPPGQGPQTPGRLGFPRAFRLVKRPEFLACYDGGRRHHTKGFILFVLKRQSGPFQWRLGLAVSRKTGNAVIRNRVKRLLREFFRLHAPEIPGGIDIVAVPKKHLDAKGLTLGSLTSDLEPALRQIKASQEPPARQGSP